MTPALSRLWGMIVHRGEAHGVGVLSLSWSRTRSSAVGLGRRPVGRPRGSPQVSTVRRRLPGGGRSRRRGCRTVGLRPAPGRASRRRRGRGRGRALDPPRGSARLRAPGYRVTLGVDGCDMPAIALSAIRARVRTTSTGFPLQRRRLSRTRLARRRASALARSSRMTCPSPVGVALSHFHLLTETKLNPSTSARACCVRPSDARSDLTWSGVSTVAGASRARGG